ncbi:MAG: hypothetical protein ACI87E_003807, partial [Mariniblastus sp.]
SEALLLTVAVVGITWLTSNATRWFRGVQNARRETRASLPIAAVEESASAAAPENGSSESSESPPPTHDSPESDDEGVSP